MSNLLEVQALEARYGRAQVLSGIDFSVSVGGVTAILGANGSGKTTTLRAVCGAVACSGRCVLEGRDILGLATASIARLGVAHVPEGRGTFSRLSVCENLRLGAYSRSDRHGVAEDFERVLDYFPVLRERFQQQAGTLSGGEQQMLAIARALMLRPRLMLLDEPSFGLAPRMVRHLFEIVERIATEEEVGILLVEQNAALALDLADQAYVLETGRIAASGPAAELRTDDRLRQSYLGY